MKKARVLIILLAVTALVLGSAAYAADAAAKPAAKDAKAAAAPAKPAGAPAKPAGAPAAAAAKPAKKAPQGVKCDVTGKVVSAKNKKGQEVSQIVVTEAKGADGKPVAALAGKTLNVAGPKAAEVKKLMGKVVQASGMVVKNKRITVDAVKEAAAKPAAAEKK